MGSARIPGKSVSLALILYVEIAPRPTPLRILESVPFALANNISKQCSSIILRSRCIVTPNSVNLLTYINQRSVPVWLEEARNLEVFCFQFVSSIQITKRNFYAIFLNFIITNLFRNELKAAYRMDTSLSKGFR